VLEENAEKILPLGGCEISATTCLISRNRVAIASGLRAVVAMCSLWLRRTNLAASRVVFYLTSKHLPAEPGRKIPHTHNTRC
jgi:hypothetical protein